MSFNSLMGCGSHSRPRNLNHWWTMQEANGSGPCNDLGSERNNLTNYSSWPQGVAGGGPNGYYPNKRQSSSSPGDTDRMRIENDADFQFYSERSCWGGWIRRTDFSGDDDGLFMVEEAGGQKTKLYYDNNQFAGSVDSFFVDFTASGTTPTNGWVFVVMTSLSGNTYIDHSISGSMARYQAFSGASWYGDRITLFHDENVGNAPATECDMAGMFYYAQDLGQSNIAEIFNGPEPINTVAPVVTGTPEVGQTLSTTNGTWALDSKFPSGATNGTVTYQYQWTRSDSEGGSGQQNISGATGTTYVVQEADGGKWIGCRVRAWNDGGNDSSADTVGNRLQVPSTGPPPAVLSHSLFKKLANS